MTVYVSSMILRSMRLIGEKGRGETLDATEQSECLYELNSFMDSCGINRLLCNQVVQESFALTANTVTYTIGVGATFNTARPSKIVDPCFVRDAASLDTPLQLIDSQTYGLIVQKNVGTTYPNKLYYDQGYDSSGYGTIKIYPAPNANLTLFINSWKALQNFANVSTALAMPQGYQLFIESNFAIHLAAGLTPISKELAMMARDSKAAVQSLNIPSTVSRLDSGVVRGTRTNILVGP